MILLDKTIHVSASPSRIFTFLCRVAALPLWHPGVQRAYLDESSSPAIAPGAELETVTESLGLRFVSRFVVTDAVEGSSLSWRQVRGDYSAYATSWRLAEEPGGATRVNLRLEVEYPFVLPRHRITTHAEITRELSRRTDIALVRLKDMVEGA